MNTIIKILLIAYIVLSSISCADDKPNETGTNQYFSITPLYDTESKLIDSYKSDYKIFVYVYFTLNDCQPCAEELILWNDIKNTFGNEAIVYGITNEKKKAILTRYINMLGINYPVLIDSNASIRGKNNIQITPARIITNASKKIIYRSDASDREYRFMSIVDSIELFLKNEQLSAHLNNKN